MSLDKFQEAWRAETSRTRVSIDEKQVWAALERSHGNLGVVVQWRDYREAAVALLILPLWVYLGIASREPWTWYLMIPALTWLLGFIVVDRMRHPSRPCPPGVSLLESARVSLAQVEHQIWLLRNVAWWYLLPIVVALLTYIFHATWDLSDGWMRAFGSLAGPSGFVVVLYYFVYYLNQRVVRKQLEPQRAELRALIAGLDDGMAGEVPGEYPVLLAAAQSTYTRRQVIIANVLIVAVVGVLVPGIAVLGTLVDRSRDEDYPRLAPYTDVRWEGTAPVVEIAGAWHQLYSIDGIAIEDIIAFCQHTYPDRWRKRFAEDLVEVMTGMGQAPGATVRLEVMPVGAPSGRITLDVPMTAANRRTVRDNAEQRMSDREPVDGGSTGQNEEQQVETVPFETELERIRTAAKLPAMAAFALRGGEIIEQATVGNRSANDDTPVGPDARWHLGSNTKAMTATVAAVLVEAGLLRWDSTVGEILGEAVPEMDAGHRATTLAMLLHHTGGIKANIDWFAAPEDRTACAAQLLALRPGRHGRYAYSNGGYVIAGAMMEAVTGERWEDLLRSRLFEPLGMVGSGFGAPIDAASPYGHKGGWLRWKPMDPEADVADNAPVLGPAGTVHTTLADYARFLSAHLAGAQGQGGIVTAATFAALHQPADGTDYALGWITAERDWAGGRTLSHGGSNTLWFATVWLAPEQDMAFFAVTNAGTNGAFRAADKAVSVLIERHLGE